MEMKMNKCLLIIGACLGLASCTPVEREIAEEIIIHECGASAPPYLHEPENLTFRAEKHDDTNSGTSYKNYRQYPPRKYKNDNSQKGDRGM